MHKCKHPCMHPCMHPCIHACIHACIQACIHACMFQTYFGHASDMVWSCFRHELAMFQTCFGHVSNMCWLCFRRVLVMFQIRVGYDSHMFWICFEAGWGINQTCLEHVFWYVMYLVNETCKVLRAKHILLLKSQKKTRGGYPTAGRIPHARRSRGGEPQGSPRILPLYHIFFKHVYLFLLYVYIYWCIHRTTTIPPLLHGFSKSVVWGLAPGYFRTTFWSDQMLQTNDDHHSKLLDEIWLMEASIAA